MFTNAAYIKCKDCGCEFITVDHTHNSSCPKCNHDNKRGE